MKVVARAIILDEDKRVLLGKRVKGSGAGKWALVGGKPERKESVIHTITREVKEELGILFQNPKLWKKEIDTTSVPGEIWRVYFFFGVAQGELKLKKEEISKAEYFKADDLSNIDVAFDHKDILKEFFQDSAS